MIVANALPDQVGHFGTKLEEGVNILARSKKSTTKFDFSLSAAVMSFLHGQCLVCIRLATDNVASIDGPEPLFLRVPRLSYLTAYTQAILDHFANYMVKPCTPVANSLYVASHNRRFTPRNFFFPGRRDLVVPWWLPIGVASDILNMACTSLMLSTTRSHCLELNLSLNSSPTTENGELFECGEVASSLFVGQLKMALVIRGQGLSQFNTLPQNVIESLRSIALGPSTGIGFGINTFLEGSKALFLRNVDSNPTQSTDSLFAAVKLHFLDADANEFQSVVLKVPLLQSSPKSVTTVQNILDDTMLSSSTRIVTQSAELDLETPVEFLQHHCAYADGFVHLVVCN